ncbi:Histone-lysine N-methyltransferase SETMAR [Anthophora quadrimaculata]
MTHCPYSPDLSPNDFCLFPFVKNKLHGERFSTPEEAVEAFKRHVSEIPSSDWNKCFDNWFLRMQKCLKLKGEYFQK